MQQPPSVTFSIEALQWLAKREACGMLMFSDRELKAEPEYLHGEENLIGIKVSVKLTNESITCGKPNMA